jgi:hypothetical protein
MTRSLRIVVSVIGGIAVGLTASAVIPQVRAAYARRSVKERTPKESHDSDMAKFERERSSPAWSPAAGAAFAARVQGTVGYGEAFQMRSIECRSHTCVAELRWKSREVAQRNFMSLLGVSNPALEKCASEIYLPPETRDPYETSLVLKGCQGSGNE